MTRMVHQANCVLVQGCAVLIEGPSGSGKSSLALALIDRGAQLIGDDGVTLEPRDHVLWASPPPNISGKLEIRNLGIVELPVVQGPVGLLVRLTTQAPRFIEESHLTEMMGISIPTLELYPDMAMLPLRTEWAVRKYATRP